MKTIHPLELKALIEANEPVEIIDVRPREQFEKHHLPGAHSLPSQTLTVEKLIHSRELPSMEPLYLISGSGTLARLTAAKLEWSGLDNFVVIEGGMQAWERNALPVDDGHGGPNWLHEHRRKMVETGAVAEFCAAPIY